MTIVAERLAQFEAGLIRIDRGSHHTFESGHCSMEVVAWLGGEGHTDAPACASPILRQYVITLNDRWSDEQRQQLAPYLVRMVGTADDGLDAERERIALGAVVDLVVPWLRLAGLDADADKLAAGPGSEDDVRRALRGAADRAWQLRYARRDEIKQLVLAKLKERAVAVADAVAAAVAAAAAAAAADAAAAAVAAAAADGKLSWSEAYNAAYDAARPIWEKAIAESELPRVVAIRELAAAQRGAALELLERLIKPEPAVV